MSFVKRILFIGGLWNCRVIGFSQPLHERWNVVIRNFEIEEYNLRELFILDANHNRHFFKVYVVRTMLEDDLQKIAKGFSF